MDRRRLQDIAFRTKSDHDLVADGPLVYEKSTNRGIIIIHKSAEFLNAARNNNKVVQRAV
jgi:hypothetical protein